MERTDALMRDQSEGSSRSRELAEANNTLRRASRLPLPVSPSAARSACSCCFARSHLPVRGPGGDSPLLSRGASLPSIGWPQLEPGEARRGRGETDRAERRADGEGQLERPAAGPRGGGGGGVARGRGDVGAGGRGGRGGARGEGRGRGCAHIRGRRRGGGGTEWGNGESRRWGGRAGAGAGERISRAVGRSGSGGIRRRRARRGRRGERR